MKQLLTLVLSGLTSMLLLFSASVPPASAASVEGTAEPSRTQNSQDHGKHGHRHGCHGGHILGDSAKLLGIEPKSLVQQLKQGKTLLQIAQANKGWNEQDFIKRLTESATLHIDQALAQGKMDQAKADKLKAGLPERLKKAVNRTWKDKPRSQPTTDYQNNKINWIPPQA